MIHLAASKLISFCQIPIIVHITDTHICHSGVHVEIFHYDEPIGPSKMQM